jgi:hypothetical protein
VYGPSTTVYNRFRRWTMRGIWRRLFDALARADPGDGQAIDSTTAKACRSAAGGKGGRRRRRLAARAPGAAQSPARPADWLLMWAVTLANIARWRANPGLRAWLSQCRLNNMTAVMRGVKPDDSAKLALLREIGAKAGLAATKLPSLIPATE